MDDFLDLVKMLCVFLAAMGVIFLGVIFACNAGSRASCNATSTVMKLEHQYGFWSGCLVRVDDQFIPIEQYATVRLAGKK